MRIPLEFYNHVRNNIKTSDVVRQKVSLTRKGSEYTGLCPFHNEKTPSFTVNDSKKFYHCFGCSAHGDIMRFVSETNGISYKEAVIKLAIDNGIELPKMSAAQEQTYQQSDKIYSILELANQFFVSQLNDDIRQYLNKRGVNNNTISHFAIGYSPGFKVLERFFAQKSIMLQDLLKAGLASQKQDNTIYGIFNKRIMFPIHNIYNKIVGFGGRAIGDAMPKYINSPETLVFKKSETMYGENISNPHAYKSNSFIIVEGYMDVVAMHQAGFKNSVASLGTAVTEPHIQKLWQSCDEIISCLDADDAGIRASRKLINTALPHINSIKHMSFIKLPYNLDPDDYLKKFGANKFTELIEKRIGLSEAIWQNEYLGKEFITPESRATLEHKFTNYCDVIADRALKVNFQRYFKDMTWNHVIRKKKANQSFSGNNYAISQEIMSSKQYSEIEFIEYAICSFVLKYPGIIYAVNLHETLDNLTLQHILLNDLKNWLLDIICSNKEMINNDSVDTRINNDTSSIDELTLIHNNIKNTRFYDVYLVLSSSDNLFLDTSFIQDGNLCKTHILKWFLKKHYLLLLQQEYINILNENAYQENINFSSYIEEIQETVHELNELSAKFINR